MNNLNSIIVEGNVVRAPEIRKTPNGVKICKVSIAVNRSYKNANGEFANEVSYFDVETYRSLAEKCEKNCEKGRGLRVVGRLKQNRWKTTDGKAMTHIDIIAEHVEFKPRFLKKGETEGSLNEVADAESSASEEELQMETSGNECPDEIPSDEAVF